MLRHCPVEARQAPSHLSPKGLIPRLGARPLAASVWRARSGAPIGRGPGGGTRTIRCLDDKRPQMRYPRPAACLPLAGRSSKNPHLAAASLGSGFFLQPGALIPKRGPALRRRSSVGGITQKKKYAPPRSSVREALDINPLGFGLPVLSMKCARGVAGKCARGRSGVSQAHSVDYGCLGRHGPSITSGPTAS